MVKQVSEGEIDYEFTTTASKLNSLPSCQVEIAGVKIKMGIDSQASVNVLDKLAFQKLKDKAGAPENCLRPCSTALFAYNSKKPLPTIGEIRARVTTDTGKTAKTCFCIIDGIGGNLLCYQTSVDLGILHIVNSVESRVFAQYPELFKGIGKINTDPIKLHTDTDVEPKAQKLRPIPFKYVCSNAIPKAMKFELVQSESKRDSEIQAIKIALTTGNWSDESVRQCRNLKNEFSVFKGVVLRDTHIVLPQSLREHAVDLAHASHQGIVKTKQLLREKVWFPGIDNSIERKVKGCLTCQIATPTPTPPEPLQMTELPNASWESVSMDFKGPFMGGEYIMVVADDYSRYPEAVVVTSLQAKTVIPELDKIFSRHRIPKVVRTNNGPPMNSEDFSKFANYLGFTQRKCTPLWPHANGEAERFIRTLVKSIRASVLREIESKNCANFCANTELHLTALRVCLCSSLCMAGKCLSRSQELNAS
ncbi:hypothetical protein HOLleu_11257 [Holothuria leucospilota]|uniref:Integrase catalytic domain-containing protein n=1 Tax=Holothuria leucospilota TaxID=206669 RepID=A0A9Q1HC75_HOLLE|nr:hypothetical protein HOLleu_11257 [Holothuria leucospilota]